MSTYYNSYDFRLVGLQIRNFRESRNISQEQLAYKAGLSTGTIGKIERGINNPKTDTLLRIAQVYDIPIANNKATADFLITSPLMNDEYEHNVHEGYLDVADARKAAFLGVRPKFFELVNWKEYICDYCGHETMIQNNDSTSGYRCTYCGAEDSGSIEVTCDVCGAEWPEEEMRQGALSVVYSHREKTIRKKGK